MSDGHGVASLPLGVGFGGGAEDGLEDGCSVGISSAKEGPCLPHIVVGIIDDWVGVVEVVCKGVEGSGVCEERVANFCVSGGRGVDYCKGSF